MAQSFRLIHRLAKPAWLLVLLGLALTTLGWLLKLSGYQRADACIMAGIGLMLLFGTLALWKLASRMNMGLGGPLGGLLAGLLVSLLAATGPTAAAPELAVAGGVLAAGGTAWLLVRLNRNLNQHGRTQHSKRPS